MNKIDAIAIKVIRKQHFLWVLGHLKVISEGSIVEYLPIRLKEDTQTIFLGKKIFPGAWKLQP